MTEPLSADERKDYFHPNGTADDTDEYDDSSASFNYGALFDAPDFSSIIRGRRSAVARDYEKRVKSMLKSGAMGALRTGNLPDAATILHFGPGFATAAGDLADTSDSVRKMIDMLSAPDNPWVVFAFIAAPFLAQLARNHEDVIRQIPDIRKSARKARKEAAKQAEAENAKHLEIKLPFGRKITLRLGFRFRPLSKLRGIFHLPTRDPADMVTQVFSDENLLKALEKQGIHIVKEM